MYPVKRAKLSVKYRLSVYRGNPGRRAQHTISFPLFHRTRSHTGAAAVATADDHRCPFLQPAGAGRLSRHTARNRGRRVCLRQQSHGNPQASADFLRPFFPPDIKKIGPPRIRIIRDKTPCQPVDDKVLRLKHPVCFLIYFRFIVPHPEKLRRRIGCAWSVPCDPVHLFQSQPADDLLLLACGAGVCPGNHGPERLSGPVHRQAAHHLSAERHTCHLTGFRFCLSQQFLCGFAHCAPPRLRILFHPARMGIGGVIRRYRACHKPAVFLVKHGLIPAGSNIMCKKIPSHVNP